MISVVTPSCRSEMLPIVQKCLQRQEFHDFEWIITTPFSPIELDRILDHEQYVYVYEGEKKPGTYYSLNMAWNKAFRAAQGELIVSIQDGLWFPPTLLESFWNHYQSNPRALVGAVGNQYDHIENGKPEHCVWVDPRRRTDFGSLYEVGPREIEYTCCSIPRQAIVDVGGLDEKFDTFAALSEKEMNARMDKLGYKFYLDQGLEYRAISHPRLSEEWDTRYDAGCVYYQQCLQEIDSGKRLRLDYI